MPQPGDHQHSGYAHRRDHRAIPPAERNVLGGKRSDLLAGGIGDAPWVGDDLNWLYWPPAFGGAEPRVIGGWSFAVPATATTTGFRPLRTAAWADDRFASLIAGWPGGDTVTTCAPVGGVSPGNPLGEYPPGTVGVVVAGTEERQLHPLFLPAGGPFVAHWEAPGAPRYSTRIHDVWDGKLDPARSAGAHSLLRVVSGPAAKPGTQLPNHGTAGDAWIAALNFSGAREAGDQRVGYGAIVARPDDRKPLPPNQHQTVALDVDPPQVGAFLAAERGGPIHPGPERAKPGHSVEGSKGWRGAKIDTRAIFYGDSRRDAALDFSPLSYLVSDVPASPMRTPVELVYDDDATHTTPDGQEARGRWRWQTPTMWAEPTFEAPREGDVTNINNSLFNFNFAFNHLVINLFFWFGVPGAPGFPAPKAQDRLAPGRGALINPARCPFEIAAPSIYGWGIRRRNDPWDGRFGPPKRIRKPKAPPLAKGTPSPETTAGENAGASPSTTPPAPPPETPIDREGASGASGAIAKGKRGPTKKALKLEQKPLAWHIQTVAAWDELGDPVATLQAGDFYPSATTAGGAWFCPPEVLIDAAEPPPSASLAQLMLYNGLWPESGAALGSAARLGFGTPDQATGGFFDGWYLTAAGASDAINAELRYLDAAGAARAGVLTSHGHLRWGTDSTYSLGTASVRSLVVHTDSLGAASAPADEAHITNLTVYGTLTATLPAHASTHQSGGADAIKLDDLAAPDDNTDLNASGSKHGLLPKLSGSATSYLDGTGAWTTPAGSGLAAANNLSDVSSRIAANDNLNTKGTDLNTSSPDLTAATGVFVDMDGTATLAGADFGNAPAGTVRVVRFLAAATLTYSSLSLILPGGLDITTAANDVAVFRSLGSSKWLCESYSRARNWATQAEQEAGTTFATFVSPARQQHHPTAAKTWAVWNASGSIGQSHNVDSITDSGTGEFVVVFTVDFAGTTYIMAGSCRGQSDTDNNSTIVGIGSRASGSCPVKTKNGVNSYVDSSVICAVFFGSF